LCGTRSHTKFVPHEYLMNAAAVRLAGLQGLLDTDRVYSIVVLTGIIASIVLYLADRTERAVLKWRPQVQVG